MKTAPDLFSESSDAESRARERRVRWFVAGAVQLAMDTDGRVSLLLRVSDDYMHLIHKDARARWAKEDLIGESVIEILPGSENAPVVENNAVIGFERARDVGEELGRLADQLQPI